MDKKNFGAPALFNIIKDQYNICNPLEEDKFTVITVDNIKTYIAAREEIEKLKSLDINKRLLIIIKSDKFLDLFDDIGIVGNVVTSYPRHELETIMCVEIPLRLKDYDIIALGLLDKKEIKEVAKDLKKAYYGDMLVENVLLTAVLKTKLFNLPPEINEDKIKELFHYVVSTDFLKTYKKIGNAYFYEILSEHINKLEENIQGLQKNFIKQFGQSLRDNNITEFIEYILVLFLIQKYPPLLKQLIVQRLEMESIVKDFKTDINANIFDYNDLIKFYNDTTLDKDINSILKSKCEDLDKLGMDINSLNVGQFSEHIEKYSGYFEEELNYCIHKLVICTNNDYFSNCFEYESANRIFNNIKSKFKPVLEKYKKADEKTVFANNLIDFVDKIDRMKNKDPKGFNDWVDLYKNILAGDKLCYSLDGSNFHNGFFGVNKEIEGMKKDYFNLRLDNLNKYEKYVFDNFPGFLNSMKDKRPPMVIDVVDIIKKYLDESNKVIFLVVDGMRLDLWDILEATLLSNSYVVEDKGEMLSMVPSNTTISRKCLFGGSPYLKCVSKDEPKALADALDFKGNIKTEGNIKYIDSSLVYGLGFESISKVLNRDSLVYVIVISSETDHAMESFGTTEDTLKKSITHPFEELVKELVKHINTSKHIGAKIKIIIATDHGFINLDVLQNRRYDKPNQILKHSPRFATIDHERDLDCIEDIENFYVVKEPEKYGLKDITLFYEGYLNKGKGKYVHGGLSFYETIIPFAILEHGRVKDLEPIVDISYDKDHEYRLDEESKIEVNIKNPNKNDIKDIKIIIEEFRVDWQVKEIKASDSQRVSIPIIPKSLGDIKFEVKVTYKVLGKAYELPVKKGKIKVEEKQKIKRFADDLFDEMLNE